MNNLGTHRDSDGEQLVPVASDEHDPMARGSATFVDRLQAINRPEAFDFGVPDSLKRECRDSDTDREPNGGAAPK